MRRKLFRRSLLVLAVVLGVFVVLGVWLTLFFPNGIARRIAVDQAAELGFYVSIGSLKIVPLKGSIEVTELELDAMTNHDAGLPSMVTLSRFAARADVSKVLKREALHVTAMEVGTPRIHLETRDGTMNLDRFFTALDSALTPANATPMPTPTPPPAALNEYVAAEAEGMRKALAGLPLPVTVDAIRTTNAGATIIEEGETFARVTGISTTLSLSVALDGTGTLRAQTDPNSTIEFLAGPASGKITPDANLDMKLWESGTFSGRVLVDAHDVKGEASANGTLDLTEGDVVVEKFAAAAGDYFAATGTLSALDFGAQSLAIDYQMALKSETAPASIAEYLQTFLEADNVTPGLAARGTVRGKLTSADPTVLLAAVEAGRVPANLTITSTGASEAHLVTMSGATLGGLAFDATIEVAPSTIAVDSKISFARLSVPDALGPKPVTVRIQNQLTLERFSDLVVKKASIQIPERGLVLGGSGRIDGFLDAVFAFTKDPDATIEQAGMAAVAATRDLDLSGSAIFNGRGGEIEVIPEVFAKGAFYAAGRLRRGTTPATRLNVRLSYNDFGARVDDIEAIGLFGQMAFDKTIYVGGRKSKTKDGVPEDVAEVEEAMASFDPAQRGYYSRLAAYRIGRENLRAKRIKVGPYLIEDLVAHVNYDGEAIRTPYFRMRFLGGETVGRAYVRPEAKGMRIAFFADFAGIDVAPILREKPPEKTQDASRVNGSSAASAFIPSANPGAGLARARARMDFTAAGSAVIEEVLLFLDPEQVDPVYNWARDINKRVVGLSRPQLNIALDKGFYDVTIGFPSLAVAKEVRRVPLGQTLALRFTQDLLQELLPPEEVLQLASAEGIDADGNWVFIERSAPEEP